MTTISLLQQLADFYAFFTGTLAATVLFIAVGHM